MVTISCSCGAVSGAVSGAPVRNPLRGLTFDERAALVRSAFSVHAGFLTVELDASWHPSSDEPTEACLVLADLDAFDASEGLAAADARRLRSLLEVSHVRAAVLPAEVEVGPVRFRATPADDFRGQVAYLAHDGAQTLLEADGPTAPHLLADLVDLYRSHGRAALVQVDGLAPRIGLVAALEGIRRARTASVA